MPWLSHLSSLLYRWPSNITWTIGMIRPWWSKGKDIGCPTRLKCCKNMILLGRHFLGNPIWYMLVQRAYSAATHTTTANAYEQSKRRGEHVGRIRLRILRFLRTSGGQSHIALTIVYVLLALFSFFFLFLFFSVFFAFSQKKPGIWILWNMRKIGFSPERGAKNAYYRIPALYGKKKRKKKKNGKTVRRISRCSMWT